MIFYFNFIILWTYCNDDKFVISFGNFQQLFATQISVNLCLYHDDAIFIFYYVLNCLHWNYCSNHKCFQLASNSFDGINMLQTYRHHRNFILSMCLGVKKKRILWWDFYLDGMHVYTKKDDDDGNNWISDCSYMCGWIRLRWQFIFLPLLLLCKVDFNAMWIKILWIFVHLKMFKRKILPRKFVKNSIRILLWMNNFASFYAWNRDSPSSLFFFFLTNIFHRKNFLNSENKK